MESVCIECQQKAEFICFCQDIKLCKACIPNHQKKVTGPHKLVLIGDPDLEKIQLEFNKTRRATKGPKKTAGGKKKPAGPKKPSKTPEEEKKLADEKDALKQRMNEELQKLQNFKREMISKLSNQAARIIQHIVGEHDKAKEILNRECGAKQSSIQEAIIECDKTPANGDIERGNVVLAKVLDAPDLNALNLVNSKCTVKEKSISLEGSLTFQTVLMPLKSNTKLQEFLSANATGMNEKIKQLFDDVLAERHHAVTEIKLTKVSLGKDGAKHLATILPKYSKIKSLRLVDTELGVEGAKKIATGLSSLKGLQKLCISKNSLGGQGGKSIAAAIKDLNQLKTIDLSSNKLGNEGTKFIAAALKNLVELRSLRLSNNNLSTESARALASILVGLKKLKTLNLADNSFEGEDRNMLNETTPKECNLEL
ncbi:unnamed protein product [Blepharisma stoltei]|uniref:B box-type domain-containing protein n=1 Tax=Blepharisma stoltei TaxID=1481888 RepID=A0AAU9JVY5_9CILI|nr:unnamed protein product [Blepharisma stoltei]